MPHSVIFSAAPETPTKWQLNMAGEWPKWRSNHFRAVAALYKVSTVVNDLEEIINKVVSGRSRCKRGDNWLPSMEETKCTRNGDVVCARLSSKALHTMLGTRS